MVDKYTHFACPNCGQRGQIVWQGDGVEHKVIALSIGFHVEVGRLGGDRDVVICNLCDEIDPAPLP